MVALADTYTCLFDTYFAMFFADSDHVKPDRINQLNGFSMKARECYQKIVEALFKSKDSLEPNVNFINLMEGS